MLQLSKDKKSILIYKKIPNPNKQYVIGVDTVELKRIKMVIKILTLKDRLRPYIGNKIRDVNTIKTYEKIEKVYLEDRSKTNFDLEGLIDFLQQLIVKYEIRLEEAGVNESESEDDIEELMR